MDSWHSRNSIMECNLHMLTSEEFCDVSFRVGKVQKIVRAHRYVLISRSSVFRVMLCGPLAETDDIRIPDVEADVFYQLLLYLYTDSTEPTHYNVMSLLYLAKKYGTKGLESLCISYIEDFICVENACIILGQAYLFDEERLFQKALSVILENADKCIKTNDFIQLCRVCFHRVISSVDITVKPEHIISAALSWGVQDCIRQQREVTAENLRLSLDESFHCLPFIAVDLTRQVKGVVLEQLMTKAEIQMITACRKSSLGHRSLFQIRSNNNFDVITKTLPVTDDIIFYDRHRKLSNDVGTDIGGGLDFICNQDVVLAGMYLYKPTEPSISKYHVTIQKFLSQIFFENNQYEVNTHEGQEHPITEVILKQPLPITKGVRYCLYVQLTARGHLCYAGDGERNQVTVGECTFKKQSQEYVNNFNLIYGFIIQQ